MEEPEVPINRRKTGVGEDTRNGNGLLPSSANKSLSPADKKEIRSQYQMNPKVLERLRKITKDCKKTLVLPKDEKSCDKQSQEAVENGISVSESERAEVINSSDDVIISSVGSSPASSPKPTDLVVLSTPPKKAKPPRTVLDGAQDEVNMPTKKVKLIDKFDGKVSPLESRKRKFDEVVLNSRGVDTCAKKIGFDKKANNKCNGNASLVSCDPLKKSESLSGVSHISNEVSKGEAAQTSSSSGNKKIKEPDRDQLENNSTQVHLVRKDREVNEQQRTFYQSGETRDFGKQAHKPSTKDRLIKDDKTNEFNKQRPVEKTCKDQCIDAAGVQKRNNISLDKEKENPVVPCGKTDGQNLLEGEQRLLWKNSVKSSFPGAEKQNEESTKTTKSEEASNLESGQQRTRPRRARSEFNSYEFKEALKTLVAERMQEMQKTFIGTPETIMLQGRIENLERENRELRSYSERLEETLKDLLSKQKKKVEGRMCKEIQTEDNWDLFGLRGANTRTPPVTRPSSTASGEPSMSSVTRMTSSTLSQPGSNTQVHQIPVKHVQHVSSGIRVSPLVTQAVSQSQPYPPSGPAVTQTTSPIMVRNTVPISTSRPAPVTATVHPQPPTLVSNSLSRPPPPYDSPRVVYTSIRPPAPQMGMQVVYTVSQSVHSAEPAMQISQAHTLVQPQAGPQGVPQVRAQITPTQRNNVAPGGLHSQPPPLGPPPLASSVVMQPSRAPQPADPRFVHATPTRIPPRPEMIIERHTSPQGPYKPQANFQGHPQVIPQGMTHGLHPAGPRAPPPVPQQGMIRGPPPISLQTPVTLRGPPVAAPQVLTQQRGTPPTFQHAPPQGPPLGPRAPPHAPQPSPQLVRPPQQKTAPPTIEVSPTTDDSASEVQSPVEAANITEERPPKPTVSIAVVMSGIVLSWNMQIEDNCAQIVSYQLFALQDNSSNSNQPNPWKKIGVVKALPLPMACTLTQFLSGNKYHFMVRAVDKYGRTGTFSDPCTITLN